MHAAARTNTAHSMNSAVHIDRECTQFEQHGARSRNGGTGAALCRDLPLLKKTMQLFGLSETI
jgi:hypothetical protein